jgi:uncharacterized membrane protein HdeD (DUF308 family)
MQERLERAIHEHRGWYMFEGILFILFGLIAIIAPHITALGFSLLIGWLLILAGGVRIYLSLRSNGHWWAELAGLGMVLVGVFMLAQPVAGAVGLSVLLIALLYFEAVAEIGLALAYRPQPRWVWLLAAGMVTLVLAITATVMFPQGGILLLGVIIGVNMLMYGISVLALSWQEYSEVESKKDYLT